MFKNFTKSKQKFILSIMKKSLLILCTLTIISVACNKTVEVDKEYIRSEEFDDGITTKRVYLNQNEYDLDKKYQYYSYYSDGTLMEEGTFVNGLLEGNAYFFDKLKGVYTIEPYVKGMRHGISKTYNQDNNILTEVLYLNDKKIRWKMFTLFVDMDRKGYQILKFDSVGFGERSGYFYINENNEPIDSIGYYYFVRSPKDTIKYGEKYKAEIQILVSGGDTIYGEILIGELNENTTFVDTSKIVKLKIGNDKKATFTTMKYNEGDNLILGKILVIQDTLIDGIEYTHESEFLLFHSYYVKKWF